MVKSESNHESAGVYIGVDPSWTGLAVTALGSDHEAQILGYLRASRIEHGLLVNFGARKFQIKKFILSHHQLLNG